MGPGPWAGVLPTAASSLPGSRGRVRTPSKWAQVPDTGLCALLGPSGPATHSLKGHLVPFPGHCLKVASRLLPSSFGMVCQGLSRPRKSRDRR